MRLDKWLWFARFYRTRTLAAEAVSRGWVRINGARVTKPARSVGPGDVLTLRQGDAIRVIRVLGLAARRGPFAEAQALYADLDDKDA